MFNVISSKNSIPEKIDIYTIDREKRIINLKQLRELYYKIGWNIMTLKNKLGFMVIDKDQLDKEPPLLDGCWKVDSQFIKDSFNLFFSLENQNQFSHSLFTALQYNIFKNLKENIFVMAKELKFSFKKDILFSKPKIKNNSFELFEGVQFIPSLKKEDSNIYPLYIVNRVVRIKGKIKGSPKIIQNETKLDTDLYFKKLNQLLKELIGDNLECVLSNFIFEIKGQTEKFELRLIEDLNKDIELNEDFEKYDEDDIYLDEIEEEYDDEEKVENESQLENEILEYVFPKIPKKLEYGIFDDPPLWIGRNEKHSNTTTMHLLNQYGPFLKPKSKIAFIPLYPKNQPNIKEKILKVSNLIVNGNGTGLYDFPGLKKRFGLDIILSGPQSMLTNLNKNEFKRELENILIELKNQIPNLPLKFKLNSEIMPFFIIGFSEVVQKEWGKYSPLYQYFKENLINLGYPNQIIKNFPNFLSGDWISFPLWSIATSIFAKIGGVPWQVDANTTKNNQTIDAYIGFRFARAFASNENKYILGIATIFTGNGRYIGFKVRTIDFDDNSDNYNFFFRSHGYTRMYEGLKIPYEDVKNIFNDAIRLIEENDLYKESPGAIVIHRLGSVSNEEANSFTECFESSKYIAGSLVSMSEFPLKWDYNNKSVMRGTWITLDEKSGLLFPQGICKYYQGTKDKLYIPSSIPKSFKIKILRDNGVYNKPSEAGYDIMSLSRMNWRHTTYIPSNYPISLEYSLILAQNIKNNIIPTGDLILTPWFL